MTKIDQSEYGLLKDLTQSFGPSGNEKQVAELITKIVSQYCNEVYTDVLGNLIARKNGSRKKVMISAHMDEIGIIVTHVDNNGFLRFAPIGGIKNSEILYRKVIFSNGRIGVIGREKSEKTSETNLLKFFIDIGASSKEEAEEIVNIGDMAVFVGEFVQSGNRFISKALDNRVGCFIALEVLKHVTCEHELFFVFTAQEEIGTRGAKTAAYTIEPDLAIIIDTTIAEDIPKAVRTNISLNKGVGIKVMDRSIVVSPKIKTWIAEIAENHKIPYQWEVLEKGGTDSGPVHLTKGGVPTGVISIPVRYLHSSNEMVDKKDIEAAVKLLLNLLQNTNLC